MSLPSLSHADPALAQTLRAFAEGLRGALGDNLVAVYVTGSLLMGDFAPASSDVDFLVVTSAPPRTGEAERLAALHAELARRWSWGGRLEGGYAARAALRPWGIEGAIAAIEPGEALRTSVPSDYSADNMAALRAYSLTLHGPPAEQVLPPVDRATLDAALREYLAELVERPDATARPETGELASWALNIARCLFGLREGRPCTKSEAAVWLSGEAPALAPLLSAALAVRRGAADPAADAILRTDFEPLRRVAEQTSA